MHPRYIPFNRPHVTGREIGYINEAIAHGHLSGNGPFARKCQEWLERREGGRRALLTNSCTAALELAALLADIRPGDEVIMPSFTFVSTANAFVLRGATPVFVDVRPDTLNLDETKVAAAITSRTRAVVPVHYAGVSCEMDAMSAIADEHGVLLIADAAHCIMATYRDRPVGSYGHLAAVSFHETKNVLSGEGGALLINDPRFVERAEVIHDKGTDRRRFLRGEVDKYTWVDVGSSYAPSEIVAAFLWAQLGEAELVTERRRWIWSRYHDGLASLELEGRLRRPSSPGHCQHNAHMYYLLMGSREQRDQLIATLAGVDINAVFHYVPLHASRAGRRYGRAHGELVVTESVSERLLRLPLWPDMREQDVDRVVDAVHSAVGRSRSGGLAAVPGFPSA